MDHVAQARSRIAWQYRNSPKFRAWIDTLPTTAQDALETPLQTLADLLEIDQRRGELLDIIGRIVGIDRPVSVDGSGGDASDEVMRILIRARIEKNNGPATIDNIVRSLRFFSGVADITVIDNFDMTFLVLFGNELADSAKLVLQNFDVVPRPAGVRFLGFVVPEVLPKFGVDGLGSEEPAPNVEGLGELGFQMFAADDVIETSDGGIIGGNDLQEPVLPTEGGYLAELYEVQ